MDMLDLEAFFSLSGAVAMVGWGALVVAVLFRITPLRDAVARIGVPLVLAVFYAALIAGWFAGAEGDYNSLAGVRALFETPELLLAGWIHYLAFDLFVGAWIAEEAERRGLPRLLVLPLLALTLLFGPIGLLALFIARPLAAARP
jgi:hypothetical protein